MICSKKFLLITFGACLLGLSTLGSLKHPVTRPNKAHGFDTVVVSLADGSFVATEHGQGTHAGNYTTRVEGQMTPNGQIIWGKGYLTAANGDELWMTLTPAGPDSFVITGGTGRFEGASGSGTIVNSEMHVEVDPVSGIMTITNEATMEGTITY